MTCPFLRQFAGNSNSDSYTAVRVSNSDSYLNSVSKRRSSPILQLGLELLTAPGKLWQVDLSAIDLPAARLKDWSLGHSLRSVPYRVTNNHKIRVYVLFYYCWSTLLCKGRPHREWIDTKQQLISWLDLALLGCCCLVTLHFLCDILPSGLVESRRKSKESIALLFVVFVRLRMRSR